VYRAELTSGGVAVTAASTHTSVASAISQSASAIPAGFAQMIEPRYGGLSAGTMRISEACQSGVAEAAATRMMGLLSEIHCQT